MERRGELLAQLLLFIVVVVVVVAIVLTECSALNRRADVCHLIAIYCSIVLNSLLLISGGRKGVFL